MSGAPDKNLILPRDNSGAPSLVLFDIDNERDRTGANATRDDEDPNAPDKTIATSSNLLG